MSDDSAVVLEGYLERAMTGVAEARQQLLELARDRLMGHARRFLHGTYARLEPLPLADRAAQQQRDGADQQHAPTKTKRRHS